MVKVEGKTEMVIGYVTCRELDAETIYWQYGGAFPMFRKSLDAYRCVEAAYKYQQSIGIKRISAYVENNNQPMLRLFLSLGFVIIGTRLYREHLMVDMLKEF